MNEKQYVLTFPWSENQEMKDWLYSKVAILNKMLDYLADDLSSYDELFLESGGIEYIVTGVITGVVENHKDSEALVTFECMQIPSADHDYTFEISEEYFKKYFDAVTKIYNADHSVKDISK